MSLLKRTYRVGIYALHLTTFNYIKPRYVPAFSAAILNLTIMDHSSTLSKYRQQFFNVLYLWSSTIWRHDWRMQSCR